MQPCHSEFQNGIICAKVYGCHRRAGSFPWLLLHVNGVRIVLNDCRTAFGPESKTALDSLMYMAWCSLLPLGLVSGEQAIHSTQQLVWAARYWISSGPLGSGRSSPFAGYVGFQSGSRFGRRSPFPGHLLSHGSDHHILCPTKHEANPSRYWR